MVALLAGVFVQERSIPEQRWNSAVRCAMALAAHAGEWLHVVLWMATLKTHT